MMKIIWCNCNRSSEKRGKLVTQNAPIIGLGGASIIGIAIIIAGLFVYFGLKGNTNRQASPRLQSKINNNQRSNRKQSKKENKSANVDEKKELRKKLLTGKIDQEMYDEEMKKLI